MRTLGLPLAAIALLLVSPLTSPAIAHSSDGDSRQAIVEQGQAPTAFERLVTRAENTLLNETMKWHPFFEGAYSGGGFAPGVGYVQHVSPYSTVDVRGNVSIRGYKLAEAEFIFSRL